MSLFGNLPVELIHQILLLEGSLKNRNGKWMNQIKIKKETKYKISQCINLKFKSNLKSFEMVAWGVQISNTKKKLSLFIQKTNEQIYIINYYIVDFSDPKTYYGNKATESYEYYLS